MKRSMTWLAVAVMLILCGTVEAVPTIYSDGNQTDMNWINAVRFNGSLTYNQLLNPPIDGTGTNVVNGYTAGGSTWNFKDLFSSGGFGAISAVQTLNSGQYLSGGANEGSADLRFNETRLNSTILVVVSGSGTYPTYAYVITNYVNNTQIGSYTPYSYIIPNYVNTSMIAAYLTSADANTRFNYYINDTQIAAYTPYSYVIPNYVNNTMIASYLTVSNANSRFNLYLNRSMEALKPIVSWVNITDYPSACEGSTFIQGLDDVPSCVDINSTIDNRVSIGGYVTYAYLIPNYVNNTQIASYLTITNANGRFNHMINDTQISSYTPYSYIIPNYVNNTMISSYLTIANANGRFDHMINDTQISSYTPYSYVIPNYVNNTMIGDYLEIVDANTRFDSYINSTQIGAYTTYAYVIPNYINTTQITDYLTKVDANTRFNSYLNRSMEALKPSIDGANVTSGTISADRFTHSGDISCAGGASCSGTNVLVGSDSVTITVPAQPTVHWSNVTNVPASVSAAQPNIDWSNITSGVPDSVLADQPDIDAANITSGTVDWARLPVAVKPNIDGANITSGSIADARLGNALLKADANTRFNSYLNRTMEALKPSIDGANITSGSIADARLGNALLKADANTRFNSYLNRTMEALKPVIDAANITSGTINNDRIQLLKDLVAGDGLTGGADNVLVGTDTDVTVNLMACGNNQILQNTSGTGWACADVAAGGVTSVTGAGAVVSSGGATPEITLIACDADQILQNTSGSGWACADISASGAAQPNIDAANVTSGTMAWARLPVAVKPNIDGANITSGSVADARLGNALLKADANTRFNAYLNRTMEALKPSIDGANITSGSVADARLGNALLKADANTRFNSYLNRTMEALKPSIDGANITSGSVADARLGNALLKADANTRFNSYLNRTMEALKPVIDGANVTSGYLPEDRIPENFRITGSAQGATLNGTTSVNTPKIESSGALIIQGGAGGYATIASPSYTGLEFKSDNNASRKVALTLDSGVTNKRGLVLYSATADERKITPNSNNAYDLGTSTYYWNNLYVDDLIFNGASTISTSSGDLTISPDGDTLIVDSTDDTTANIVSYNRGNGISGFVFHNASNSRQGWVGWSNWDKKSNFYSDVGKFYAYSNLNPYVNTNYDLGEDAYEWGEVWSVDTSINHASLWMWDDDNEKLYHIGVDEVEGMYTESIDYSDLTDVLEYTTVYDKNSTHEIQEDKWVLKTGKSLRDLGETLKVKKDKVEKISIGLLKQENDALKELLIEKGVIKSNDLTEKINLKKLEKSYSGTTKVKNKSVISRPSQISAPLVTTTTTLPEEDGVIAPSTGDSEVHIIG